jgi:opacity protein-like surface antigen
LNVKKQALLLNFNYYPLGDKQRFFPYLGIGIGASRNKVSQEIINLDIVNDTVPDGKRFNKSVTKLAWSLQAGFQYKLNNNLYLNTSYKFINFGRIKGNSSEYSYNLQIIENDLPTNIKGDLYSHILMIGLGYKF